MRYDDDIDVDDDYYDESNNLSSNKSSFDLLSDVKDDVFMGFNEDQDVIMSMKPMQLKVEIDDEEIDQVVPSITSYPNHEYEISCEDSSLDVIVLYVN